MRERAKRSWLATARFRAHAVGLAAIGRVTTAHHEPGNVGWAWVRLGPGNRGFGRWLLREQLAGRAYGGGVQVSAPATGTTNMDPQMRYARAFADVVNASNLLEPSSYRWADGRLDGDF